MFAVLLKNAVLLIALSAAFSNSAQAVGYRFRIPQPVDGVRPPTADVRIAIANTFGEGYAALRLTPDGGRLAGGTGQGAYLNAIFLTKYDATGNIKWQRLLDSTDSTLSANILDVSVANTGAIYVATQLCTSDLSTGMW